jgi:transcriptional regulator with XRE-family HTH domain
MAKKRTSSAFRQEIASCLKRAIREKKLSKKAAAARLGVKRQMLWLYLTGKAAPGPEILRRASKLWKLTLSDGTVLGPDLFGPENKPRGLPKQLRLFEALEEIQPNQIETRLIGRIGDFFEFRVRIKVAS